MVGTRQIVKVPVARVRFRDGLDQEFLIRAIRSRKGEVVLVLT